MDLLNQSLLVIIINTSAMALLYLYTYSRTRQTFAVYLGVGWQLFAFSFLFDIGALVKGSHANLILWKMGVTLAAFVCIYLGLNEFLQVKGRTTWVISYAIPGVVVSTWIMALVTRSPVMAALPLSMAILIFSIAGGLGFMLYDWERDTFDKYAAGWLLLLLGLHRAFYPVVQSGVFISRLEYTTAILIVNLINIIFLFIYFQYAQDDLAKREARFRLLAENAGDFIYQYRIGTAPAFLYASPASLSVTGYPPEKFYKDPGLLGPNITEHFNVVAKSGGKTSENIVFQWKRPDGSEAWLEQKNNLVYDEDGNPFMVEGIIRDITDRKLGEEKLLRMEDSRKHLLANISHDLKSPITMIQGYLQAMTDGLVTDEATMRNYLRLSLQKTLGLSRLISDLFDLSQYESRSRQPQFEIIPLIKLVGDIKDYQTTVVNSGRLFSFTSEILWDGKVENLHVIADPAMLGRVLDNIFGNALKFSTPESEIKAVLRRSDKASGNSEVIVSIANFGDKVKEEDLEKVFERFFKARRDRNLSGGGSGLGLAISREVMDMHGGAIWAENKPAGEFIVSFSLPLYE